MTVRVHALEDSGDYKPDGDCYAPQVITTVSYGRWETHGLNAERFLPFPESWVTEVYQRIGMARTARYFRAFWGIDCQAIITRGHAQGDWGYSFVFATPEWLEMTGAPGINKSDHNDFCAWLWGDVYGVFDDEAGYLSEDSLHAELRGYDKHNPLIVYGSDEAEKYGEITYPTHRTVVSYEYD